MRHLLALVFLLALVSAADAQTLPAPPATSATKTTWVNYARSTYEQANTIIAQKNAEIAALKAEAAELRDVRLEVIEWVRGQAVTSSVKVTISANGTLLATWKDNSAGNQGRFRVYRSGDGVNFAPVHETQPNITSFRDTGLVVGASYWYFVTEFDSNTESAASNTATGAP